MKRITACLFAACLTMAGQTLDQSTIPAAVRVPDGNRLAHQLLAVGEQVYKCELTNGVLAYGKATPSASLWDQKSYRKGAHGAGPFWRGTDGSEVTATPVKDASAPAPNPHSVPWLLLKATPKPVKGMFSDVTFVQRLYTGGGAAPGKCTREGEQAAIPYVAIYYLWVVAN